MTKLLNLPGVIVEKIQEAEGTLILSVKVPKKTAKCPRCSHTSHRLHQNQRHLVRDLPICNREVMLYLNRRRFKCDYCKKPFSECLDFVGYKKKFTHRYAHAITKQVIHGDVINWTLDKRKWVRS
ncbi:MAG: transposase family protein [Coleofasciculus sp. G2-EDA-02]